MRISRKSTSFERKPQQPSSLKDPQLKPKQPALYKGAIVFTSTRVLLTHFYNWLQVFLDLTLVGSFPKPKIRR